MLIVRSSGTWRCRSAGIVLEEGKDYLIDTRMDALARSDGYADTTEMIGRARIAPTGPIGDRIVDAMTTNETSFFRDRTPFDALRDSVLPELIEARQSTRRLIIWCAASSSGQEPYSIAMMLRDRFPELDSWSVQILATDISPTMIAKASSATYSQLEVGRGLPAPYLVRYFDQDGTRWRLRSHVRDLVTFREYNLTGAWPPIPSADIIFLRNVLIYFDAESKRTILRHVEKMLPSDGALFLGAGESVMNAGTSFERVDLPGTCCYRPAPELAAAQSGASSSSTNPSRSDATTSGGQR